MCLIPRSLFAIPLTLCAAVVLASDADQPPETRTEDVTETIHGVEVSDPYRWLENETDPEVVAWIDAQRKYTRSQLDQFPQRNKLARRFEDLFKATSVSRPAVYKNRYLFSRHEGLKNHSVLYVRKGAYDAKPKAILDPNTWSEDGTVALDWMHPTPDAAKIAYGKSAGGSELSTLHILDVETGKHLEDEIPNTRYCDLVWDPDEKGFLYTRYPAPGSVPAGEENYNRKLYHHSLGQDWRKDPVVVDDLRQKEELLSVSESSDHRFTFLSRTVDWISNDLYVRPKGSSEPFKPIITGADGSTSADAHGDYLYLMTNVDAPRYKIARAPVGSPAPENWKDIIPQRKGVIQAFDIIGGKLFVTVSQDVHSRLFIHELDGRLIKEISLPTIGTVSGVNGEPDGNEVFFSFQSFAYPPANFRYLVDSGKLEKIEQMDIDVNLDAYETKQVWFESKDGTKVPMFITHKKDMKLDGDAPTVLYGYGGFDISLVPRFDRRRLPWLESGGVWVVANIRGGGEFGKDWHLAGRRENKQRVYDDFIAAAEKLIDMKITRSERLAIFGGSNGGLLVGACMVQRPKLFGAVVCAVPLLDMVRYHHFQIARLWIPEYGSAEDAEQFKWLYAYSPYHHVKKGVKYPATLLMTAEQDTRVQPMHAYKMTAALQAATSGDGPILLDVEEKAGHGVGKPLKKRIAEQVDIYIFLMWQLGMIDAPKG